MPPILAGLWRSFICLVIGATKRMIISWSSVRFCMIDSLVVESEIVVAVDSDERTLLLLSLVDRVWKWSNQVSESRIFDECSCG